MGGSAGIASNVVLFFLVLVSATSYAAGVEAIAGTDVENRQVINATPGVLVEGVPSKDIVRCARVAVSGLSRLKLRSYSSARRITLVPSDDVPERSHNKIQICLHRNSTLGLCQCENDNWDSIQNGMWSSANSPYENGYIDVKFVDKLSGSVTIIIELELHRWRLICLAIGFVLLLLAPIVSSWVPFYYSSSMAIGVCLVVIIILFQGMKLLPTGRKSALYSTICGLAFGAGSFLLNRLSVFVNSILVNFGINQEMHNPVLVFLLVGVVLAGAAFGYWLVRKYIIADDGSVDVGVAQFVKWALRVVAVTSIFQSTLDTLLAMELLLLLFGFYYSLTSFMWHGFRDVKYSLDWNTPRRSGTKVGKSRRTEFLRRSGTTTPRGSFWRSFQSSPTFINSPVKGVVTPSSARDTDSQDYYSSYHRTPNRKKYTEEEWKDLTEQTTRQAFAELASSPEFTEWALKNADRIQLRAESSSDESIGSGPEENISGSSSARGLLWQRPW